MTLPWPPSRPALCPAKRKRNQKPFSPWVSKQKSLKKLFPRLKYLQVTEYHLQSRQCIELYNQGLAPLNSQLRLQYIMSCPRHVPLK